MSGERFRPVSPSSGDIVLPTLVAAKPRGHLT
jgi:hypothetical protein